MNSFVKFVANLRVREGMPSFVVEERPVMKIIIK
jgi:hypothetical protein